MPIHRLRAVNFKSQCRCLSVVAAVSAALHRATSTGECQERELSMICNGRRHHCFRAAKLIGEQRENCSRRRIFGAAEERSKTEPRLPRRLPAKRGTDNQLVFASANGLSHSVRVSHFASDFELSGQKS